MSASLRTWLVALLLGSGLVSCTDHQLRPLSPLGFRLKTVETVNGSNATFNYDKGNRVESYTSNAGPGLFYYDDQSRYVRYDIPNMQIPSESIRARFTYSPGSNNFTVDLFTFNGASESKFGSKVYSVDSNKRVTGSSIEGPAIAFYRVTYQYTGDNITTAVGSNLGGNVSNRLYEYDDKPNPYYGLIRLDIDELRTYSRNNVTKITELLQGGGTRVVAEYVYQYNAQGLPTQVTTKSGTELTRFTYESY